MNLRIFLSSDLVLLSLDGLDLVILFNGKY